MKPIKHFSRKYLREETLPTRFCPGCFNGTLMNALSKAFIELGIIDLRNYVFVSGIGCSSLIPLYIKADLLHTLHGRAIPVATGVKLARPDLEVIVIGGDGDLAGIGLGHLIHAAKRNMDLLVVLVNNYVYAMTRGQMSPTTPIGLVTATTPYGSFEYPINICKIIASTNANYVARWTIARFTDLKNSIKDALSKYGRGFRFIEVVAPCITYVARRLGKRAGEVIKELLKLGVRIRDLNDIDKYSREGKIGIGVLKAEDKPGYVELYGEYVKKVVSHEGT